MARPKYEDGERTARERLEDAFWHLLAHHPVSEITVGMLCARAGCNRGTFYYHFDDVGCLAERIAAENVPEQIFSLVKGYLLDERAAVSFSDEERRRIERLCLLVGKNSTPALALAVGNKLTAMRLQDLGLRWDDLDSEARLIVKFVGSGILGVLAWRADSCDTEDAIDLDEAFEIMFETFSQPALDRLRTLIVAKG